MNSELNTGNSNHMEELFQSVAAYIAQNLVQNKHILAQKSVQDRPESDFVVMDAKRWNEQKKLRSAKAAEPKASEPLQSPRVKESVKKDPFDDILSMFRTAPCPEKDLEGLLKETDAGFSETLLKLIDIAGKKDAEVYKKANIDRKLFSKIRSNKDYRPSKTTALAFAIALELDLAGTKDLIGRAGYTLTHSSRLDIIVEYFIVNKKYDIDEINITLYHFDQPCLGL